MEKNLTEKEQRKISMAMSKILRHSAIKEGLEMNSAGEITVESLIGCLNKKKIKTTTKEIQQIVNGNDKQRFGLRHDQDTDTLMIRAFQGHSISQVIEDNSLVTIHSIQQLNQVLQLNTSVSLDYITTPVHGTYFQYLQSILDQGLKRMSRNHIHFSIGQIGNQQVISGMRKNCEVLIYIDLEKALQNQLPFYVSNNNVILSPGVDGVITKEYFYKVLTPEGEQLYPYK